MGSVWRCFCAVLSACAMWHRFCCVRFTTLQAFVCYATHPCTSRHTKHHSHRPFSEVFSVFCSVSIPAHLPTSSFDEVPVPPCNHSHLPSLITTCQNLSMEGNDTYRSSQIPYIQLSLVLTSRLLCSFF